MLISDKLIYLELHKTGCTHTRSILADMFSESHKIIGMHNTYCSIQKSFLGNFDNKLKVGNIRNPWDWYVSLWAFGCEHKGGLYNVLTQNRESIEPLFSKKGIKRIIKKNLKKDIINRILNQKKGYPWLNPKIWDALYQDSENFDNFNTWLHLILSKEKFEIGEDYKTNNISRFAGFMTYRYIRLYTYCRQLNEVNTLDELIFYDTNENFINEIIRNETIHEDLIKLAKSMNYDVAKLNNILKRYQKRTNTSHRDLDYRKYYNKESISLVESSEKFIIDKYNYQF